MGLNTTIVVMNDALGSIKNDKDFGENLAQAVLRLAASGGAPQAIDSGGCVSAAIAIETHHRNGVMPVLVGQNGGRRVELVVHPLREQLEQPDLLEEMLLVKLAAKHGYTLRRKK